MDLASAEAEIRHVFGDTLITEASIGAAPPDILVKLSGFDTLAVENNGQKQKMQLKSLMDRTRR